MERLPPSSFHWCHDTSRSWPTVFPQVSGCGLLAFEAQELTDLLCGPDVVAWTAASLRKVLKAKGDFSVARLGEAYFNGQSNGGGGGAAAAAATTKKEEGGGEAAKAGAGPVGASPEALRWWRRAKDQGHANAKKVVKELEEAAAKAGAAASAAASAAAAPSAQTEPQGCGPSCSKGHSSDGNCLACGEGWGAHSGHNCSGGRGRGSWRVTGGGGGGSGTAMVDTLEWLVDAMVAMEPLRRKAFLEMMTGLPVFVPDRTLTVQLTRRAVPYFHSCTSTLDLPLFPSPAALAWALEEAFAAAARGPSLTEIVDRQNVG